MPTDQTELLVSLLAQEASERAFGDIGFKDVCAGANQGAARFKAWRTREIDEDFARQMMSTGEEPEAFSFDEPDF